MSGYEPLTNYIFLELGECAPLDRRWQDCVEEPAGGNLFSEVLRRLVACDHQHGMCEAGADLGAAPPCG